MGKKFDDIYEAVISRYEVGGYLPGDVVKFRSNYKSSPTYKAMNSVMQSELDELAKSGLNIKVVQVGPRTYNHSISVNPKAASDVLITIAADVGGNRNYGRITVSPDMIDMEDANNPTPKVPDEMKRDDSKYTDGGKPEKYQADKNHITRVTDKGTGKNTPTDLKLAGESTRRKNDSAAMAALYENTYKKNS